MCCCFCRVVWWLANFLGICRKFIHLPRGLSLKGTGGKAKKQHGKEEESQRTKDAAEKRQTRNRSLSTSFYSLGRSVTSPALNENLDEPKDEHLSSLARPPATLFVFTRLASCFTPTDSSSSSFFFLFSSSLNYRLWRGGWMVSETESEILIPSFGGSSPIQSTNNGMVMEYVYLPHNPRPP